MSERPSDRPGRVQGNAPIRDYRGEERNEYIVLVAGPPDGGGNAETT